MCLGFTPGCTVLDMFFFLNHSWHSVNGLRISISEDVFSLARAASEVFWMLLGHF